MGFVANAIKTLAGAVIAAEMLDMIAQAMRRAGRHIRIIKTG
ncbi:hypothetical protein PhaeoP97_03149 [Phaeobacter porticola]|uniref:Uncharacterized protein n=1 Tax=Phaeobacter porticola TaxID=1844006 RepID=A0A1L3I8Q0_9RHOB|nr:hypothetical protein PhaeoP97_03149 [Phaeobacter porticola]